MLIEEKNQHLPLNLTYFMFLFALIYLLTIAQAIRIQTTMYVIDATLSLLVNADGPSRM